MKRFYIFLMIFACLMCMSLSACQDSTAKDEISTAAVNSTASEIANHTKPSDADAKPEKNTEPEKTEAEKFTESVEVTQEAQEEEPKYCTINVDGEGYDALVGDVVTYVANLKTSSALEDFQVTTNYDGNMLELIEDDRAEMFPIAQNSVIYNNELMNTIKFNAVNLNGMDFTQGGELLVFRFMVKDWGFTTINTTIEYMDGVNGDPYVSDYEVLVDFDYSQEII